MMKRFSFPLIVASAVTFTAVSMSAVPAHAGWGFGFDLFGPRGSFSFHQHGPILPAPVYAPPPAPVYHYYDPGCYGPAYCAPPPCFRPFHHYHHHHHGW